MTEYEKVPIPVLVRGPPSYKNQKIELEGIVKGLVVQQAQFNFPFLKETIFEGLLLDPEEQQYIFPFSGRDFLSRIYASVHLKASSEMNRPVVMRGKIVHQNDYYQMKMEGMMFQGKNYDFKYNTE